MGRHGWKRIVQAFGYSWAGLRASLRMEEAFRQELLLAIVAIPVALFLNVTAVSKALLVSSVWLILIVELINTAIEAVVDRISTDRHPLSKKAKDVGSAAVLLAFVNAICIWGIILWQIGT